MGTTRTQALTKITATNDSDDVAEAVAYRDDGLLSLSLRDVHGEVQITLKWPESREFVAAILAAMPEEVSE